MGLEIAGRGLAPHLTVEPRRRPAVEYLWERIQEESFGTEPTKQAMCTALLAELLLELVRNDTPPDRPAAQPLGLFARRTVKQLCDEVRGQLDHPWTLTELTRRSGYSSTQLTSIFHALVGTSPCRWLRRERVRAAQELLARSDMEAIAIAVEVGFGSRSQCHRAFRSVTGMAPGRYRATVRHEEQP